MLYSVVSVTNTWYLANVCLSLYSQLTCCYYFVEAKYFVVLHVVFSLIGVRVAPEFLLACTMYVTNTPSYWWRLEPMLAHSALVFWWGIEPKCLLSCNTFYLSGKRLTLRFACFWHHSLPAKRRHWIFFKHSIMLAVWF